MWGFPFILSVVWVNTCTGAPVARLVCQFQIIALLCIAGAWFTPLVHRRVAPAATYRGLQYLHFFYPPPRRISAPTIQGPMDTYTMCMVLERCEEAVM